MTIFCLLSYTGLRLLTIIYQAPFFVKVFLVSPGLHTRFHQKQTKYFQTGMAAD
jgi:hypothetical protein